jgi:hypothetical protein
MGAKRVRAERRKSGAFSLGGYGGVMDLRTDDRIAHTIISQLDG